MIVPPAKTKRTSNLDRLHPFLEYLHLLPRSLYTNLLFSGQVGSGKTTLIKRLLLAYLWQVSPGAIHNCVKSDEADWVEELVKSTHMRDRFLRFSPTRDRFNIAAFECSRVGGSPATLARLIQRLSTQLDRTDGAGKSERYWESLFFDYLHNAALVAWLAYGKKMTLKRVHQCVMTMPGPKDLANVAEFKKKSLCGQMLMKAQSNAKSADDIQMLSNASEWILKIQPGLGSKARSAGQQSCSSILGLFLMPPFDRCFCSDQTDTFSPAEHPLNQHYVVVDCPTTVYGVTGQLANSLLTTVTVEAALRRPNPTTDTLIVRDEFQLVFTEAQQEVLWHSISRQFRLSFWDAVQNLPLLYSAFGQNGENQGRAFIGNKATQFVFANSDMHVTNKFYSEMSGEQIEQMNNFSERQQQDPQNFGDAMFGQPGVQFGASEQYRPRITPEQFLHLRKGGPENNLLVDFYMFQAGRMFDGLPYKLMTVSQK